VSDVPNTVHSQERDLDQARRVALDGLVLRTTVGSVVHGLSNPGTDDRDELGVCIEPPEYLLGFQRFEHFVFRTQPEGHPSGPGDLDLVVYGLRKFCALALKGSPTALLPLFVTGEHVLVCEPVGERLRALAPAFVARSTGRAFLGYLTGQRRGLVGERHATRTRELSTLHGYDTKYAMHALRIAYQGIELLTTGRITLPVPEPERSSLRRVRAGEVPLEDVLAHLDGVSARLEELGLDPSLPARTDVAAVEAFLVQTYRETWA
jgi:predicted nucleotidyltransferase